MNTRLFVAGLPFTLTEDELRELFSSVGGVVSSKIIMDRETGQSKGFGFVEMDSVESADEAKKKLHDSEVGGRKIVVNDAKPMEPRNDRFEKKGGFSFKKGSPQRRTYGERREGGRGDFGRRGGDR